jgi:hypothetical protein
MVFLRNQNDMTQTSREKTLYNEIGLISNDLILTCSRMRERGREVDEREAER